MLKKDLATTYNHAALIANQKNCLQKKNTVDKWERKDNSLYNTIKQIKISQRTVHSKCYCCKFIITCIVKLMT